MSHIAAGQFPGTKKATKEKNFSLVSKGEEKISFFTSQLNKAPQMFLRIRPTKSSSCSALLFIPLFGLYRGLFLSKRKEPSVH